MSNNILNTLGYDNISEYENKIITTLSSYIEKTINDDGSVDQKEVKTSYFLENNKWHGSFFKEIEQFKEQIEISKYNNKNILFPFISTEVKKKIKFIVYNKLFSDEWGVKSVLTSQRNFIKRLAEFINEKYPKLNSILDVDLNKTTLQWIDWLNNQGIKTVSKNKTIYKEYQH